jgi:hypothetical protein
MLDALLAAEQLPDEYRNRYQVISHLTVKMFEFRCIRCSYWLALQLFVDWIFLLVHCQIHK